MKPQAEHTGAAADGWESVRLGEIFDIGSSKRVLQKQWKQSGVPFYRAREIVKLAKSGSVENDLFISEEHFSELQESHGVPGAGDLMVSAVGTLGACYVVQPQDRFYFKDASVLQFRPTKEVEPRFFQYLFLSDAFLREVKKSDGATVGTLTIKRAKSLSLSLPPLEEQKRIVAVLDQAFAALDRARANAEANLAELDELSLSSSNKVFDEIEAEWWQLGELCEIYQPKTISAKEMKDDGKYVVFGANGKIGHYDKYNHEEPQLLVTCRGATCGSVNVSEPFSWITGNAMVVRPKDGRVSQGFLEQFFRGAMDWDTVITGAAQPQITRKSLAPTLVPVPDRVLQEREAASLEELQSQIEKLRAEYESKLKDLEDLRQSILQKAFAGELS